MGRYTHAVCRLCRREGMKLYLKGEKCYTEKCPVSSPDRRPAPPGMHGASRRKLSEFGVRLREKQKLRRIYGIHETQFKTYFQRAAKAKGVTGTRLLQLLETRLDNVVYRLGLATSRKEARQIVAHGHVAVDGRRVRAPSYQTRPGQRVTASDPAHPHPRMKELAEAAAAGRRPPSWLEVDPARLEARVLALPAREEIDVPVQEQLVVEYYSR
ncbi:MAG: 30S ribosomal protein S4 [Armatimonadota bacterium]|nr:30S ribosomal protein S4 [Armatimonadota bacterium]MDR7422974.1 30S ribosomal protein S4 [Armatimonadota bacterium]MDR7453997.1 30S ribosomal protein S4 [Armatimonadota bacterium]MDR7456870.1 30S ribosomal protein S4 [Armatimonadota bacterium]MDR7497691.1 30S ribosomal protein S4 [Armatimonadota bacterium]